MDLINKYFTGLTFTRIDEKGTPDGTHFAVYGAGIAGMFGDGNALYVLLFVPAHLAVQTKGSISELPWENLQTRRLKYGYPLRKQSWKPPRNLPDPIFQVTERTAGYTSYHGPQGFPFEVILLHDPRKKTKYQYYNKITLSSALETFSSSFTYRGQVSPMEYTSGAVTQNDFDDSFELIS